MIKGSQNNGGPDRRVIELFGVPLNTDRWQQMGQS